MAKKMTIEQLAAMIEKTMASKEDLKSLATKEDLQAFKQEVGVRFERVDAQFDHVNAWLDSIHHDISDLPIMRNELHDLRCHAETLEQKAGRGR